MLINGSSSSKNIFKKHDSRRKINYSMDNNEDNFRADKILINKTN